MTLRLIPLLVVPVLLYLLIWATSGGQIEARFASVLFSIGMVSGEVWHVTLSAGFIALSIVCLFVEIVRSAVPTKWAIGENMVTALSFALCLILFLLVNGFATSEFFLLMIMLLLDFVTDAAVMAITSRRTIAVSH